MLHNPVSPMDDDYSLVQVRKAAMVAATMSSFDRPNPISLAHVGWPDDITLGERRVAEAIVLWSIAQGRPTKTLKSILGI